MSYILIGTSRTGPSRYNRFMNAATMQEAQEAFQTAVYDAQTGVQTFDKELIGHAQNMAMYPDEFTIRETFLDGIPAEMRCMLIRDDNLSPEVKLRNLEAQQMVEATKTPKKGIELSSHNDDPLLAQALEKRTESSTTNDDPAVVQVLAMVTKVPVNSEHGEAQMRVHILQGYKKDRMYVEILNKPTEHSRFMIEWELIYTVNMEGAKVL
ncbi:hypothetical protein C0995_015228, partial [Termitomyces sp. Mi166